MITRYDTFYNPSSLVISPHAGAKHERAGCETHETLRSAFVTARFSDVDLLCLGLNAEPPEALSRAGALQRALTVEKSLICASVTLNLYVRVSYSWRGLLNITVLHVIKYIVRKPEKCKE